MQGWTCHVCCAIYCASCVYTAECAIASLTLWKVLYTVAYQLWRFSMVSPIVSHSVWLLLVAFTCVAHGILPGNCWGSHA